jgi:Zn-dependent protease
MSEMRLSILGASLCPSESLFSYVDEILLCAGGPAFNFASAALAVHLLGFHSDSLFVLSSIALGALNLLPVSGFDGGRISSALLNMMFSERIARTILHILSFSVLFVLWCFSLYLLLRSCASLSLFVFCLSVFAKIFLCEHL